MRSYTIRPVSWWIPALALLLAVTFPVHAQQQEVSTELLTRGAEVIILGSVTEVTSSWTPDRSRIVSLVTIRVEESLKGAAASTTVTLTVPGGEVDGVGELYTHAPRFRTDEQVVVFGRRDAQGTLRVAGGDQGKVAVLRDERSGRLITAAGEALEAFTTRVRRAVAADARH
jgi:hypothetical protein